MKRVLIVGFTENLGGVERLIYSYYKKIDRSRLQFDFLINVEKVPFRNEIEKLGGRFFVIPRKTKDYVGYKNGLKAFFDNHAKDYIAFWFNSNSLANLDYLAYAYRYGIEKRIVHSHNTMETRGTVYKVFHQLNKGKARRMATDYWACSIDAGRFFFDEDIVKSDKFRVINNAIDLCEFSFDKEKRVEWRKKIGIADNVTLYGNVGRLSYQKNHEFLLRAFKGLVSKHKNVHLILIGTGELEENIKRQIEDLKLEKNVSLMGRQFDIPGILQAVDVFVMPSHYEGLPIAAIEAQAAGLPCIMSDTITKEVKFLHSCEYEDIASEDKWILAMEKAAKMSRSNDCTAIKKAGFDIEEETAKLEEYLLS